MTKRPRKPASRKCVADGCDVDFGLDGPMPFAADVHLVNDELVVTCSPQCRARMGFAERKCATTGE